MYVGDILLNKFLDNAKNLYSLDGYEFSEVPGHEGGRNLVYVCAREGEPEYVLRLSILGDKNAEE